MNAVSVFLVQDYVEVWCQWGHFMDDLYSMDDYINPLTFTFYVCIYLMKDCSFLDNSNSNNDNFGQLFLINKA